MYCRFCGTEISNQSQFCSACGKPQAPAKITATSGWPRILCCIIGVFFILGGVLPYLLQGNLETYRIFLASLYGKYPSPAAVAAINCFTQFSSSLTPVFWFFPSVLTLYTGLLLLKKGANPIVPLVICNVAHIASIIHSVLVNLAIYCVPTLVLSVFAGDAAIIAAGEKIIRAEPGLLYYYQGNAICRAVIAVFLIALSVVPIVLKIRYRTGTADKKTSISSAGGVVMMLSVSVLSVLGTSLSSDLGRAFFGQAALAANSAANAAFGTIRVAILLAFFAIIGIAVIFNRVRRWIIAIPTVGAIVLLGLVAIAISDLLMRELTVPANIITMATGEFRGLIIGSTVTLLAMFSWMSAVTRNNIPMWLQFALPLLLPILYIGIEMLVAVGLHINPGISVGLISIDALTILVSLFVHRRRKA